MLGLLPALPCLLLLALPGPSAGSNEDGTVVLTTSGPIQGKRLPVGSSSVTAFLGVPYAQPPVGPLRFQKPLPHQPWSDVLEATSFGHACPQPPLPSYPDAYLWKSNISQSEDCLFLNVWVPQPWPQKPAPILIWIHGMGFVSGASSLDVYDGRFLAAAENVIVASMNYRLGSLGFLALPPAAPGNAGLWDQRLALRWLRDNAAAFGGDPARVMLFGQCAGAASVGFHLLSPGSRPLFTRAVLQSGVPTAPWIWSSLEEAQERSRRLGQLLGCTESDDTALVSCLQGKEPEEFPKYMLSIVNPPNVLQFPFVPTVDGDFLPDTPPRLLQAQNDQPIPILIGMDANEGSYILLFAAHSLHLDNTSAIGWEQLLQVVRLMVPRAPEEAVQAVAQRYIQDVEGQGEAPYRWAMDQMLGDYFIVCPTAEMAEQEAEAGSPVYAYSFAHRTSGLSTPKWTSAPHGSELPYVFGTQVSVAGAKPMYTEAEVGLSRRMMRYWAEFARSGTPTGEGGTGELWPRYDPLKQNFFSIRLNSSRVVEMELTRHCSFLAPLGEGKSTVPGTGSGPALQQEPSLKTAAIPGPSG